MLWSEKTNGEITETTADVIARLDTVAVVDVRYDHTPLVAFSLVKTYRPNFSPVYHMGSFRRR